MSGNYIGKVFYAVLIRAIRLDFFWMTDQPRIGDEDTDSEDDEPAYRLEDVSSDVEMYADDFGDDDDENEGDGEEMGNKYVMRP